MTLPRPSNGEAEKFARLATLLDHLERRRASLDQGMWQAPALTIAAQAFLLQVLTNQDVDRGARFAILIAGLTAILAAVVGLLRQRAREVRYSEAIGYYFVRELDLPDPRPGEHLPRLLLERNDWQARFDARTRDFIGQRRTPVLYLWASALVVFAVVDAVAFCLSR